MAKRAFIGVDMGTYSTKMALVEAVEGAMYVKSKASISTPVNTSRNLPLKAWLAPEIKAFIKENKIKGSALAVTTSREQNFFFLELPKLNPKELQNSVNFEATRHVKEGDLHKWTIAEEGQSAYQIIVATLRESLARLYKGIKSVRSVEPLLPSISRLVPRTGFVTVIDFGHIGTRVMCFRQGIPFAFQQIEIGGLHLTEKIVEALRCSVEEADSIKRERGAVLLGNEELVDDPAIKEIADILAPEVRRLTDEIKKAIHSLELQQDFIADEIYYTGGNAKLRFLPEYVSRAIGYNLIPLDQLTGEEDDYDYMQAVGASLLATTPYLTELDFVKIPRNFTLPSVERVCTFALCLSLGAYSALGLANFQLNRIEKQVNEELQATESRVSSIQNQIDSERNQIRSSTRILDILSGVEQQKAWLSDFLFILPECTPEGVTVTLFDLSHYSARIEGNSDSYSNIGFFVIALEEYADVNISQIDEATGGRYSFVLEATLKAR